MNDHHAYLWIGGRAVDEDTLHAVDRKFAKRGKRDKHREKHATASKCPSCGADMFGDCPFCGDYDCEGSE